MKKIIITSNKKYSIEDLYLVAYKEAVLEIEDGTLKKISGNFQATQNLDKQKNVYGLTTGVGDLSTRKPILSIDQVQKNILLSHAVGMGENLPKEIVRGTIFSRLIVLSNGTSGVSPELIRFLIDLLNNDIIPQVPSLGSIGASDLTILAGTFVILCNKGKVEYGDKLFSPFEAFKKAGILYPDTLKTREGLALINGKNTAIALSGILIKQIEDFLDKSLEIAAISLEARGGTYAVYTPYNQKFRPFKGQKRAAKKLQNVLKNSTQILSSYENKNNTFLQEPPSFKTIAQLYGNAFDVLESAKLITKTEMNSITDNPLLLTEENITIPISSGNYLCMQLATAMDTLSLVLAQTAQSSAARMKILLNDEYNEGLPRYLIEDSTNNSGFMISTYSVESILSEIKGLLYPKSIFSSIVANGWEDISSNAMNAALNVQKTLNLTQNILLFEMAIASQALSLRMQKNPSFRLGLETAKLLKAVQKIYSSFPIQKDEDVYMYIKVLQEKGKIV